MDWRFDNMKTKCYELDDGVKICFQCIEKQTKGEEIYCECIKCPHKDICNKICCLPLIPFSKYRSPKDS